MQLCSSLNVLSKIKKKIHCGMQSQVGLRKQHKNKASGGEGIPVELFQIIKDDAVKVLHSNKSANL